MKQEIANAVVTTPIFFDWSFWTAFFAAVAVILSQLPPIKTWFKQAKIDLELYSKISLTHKVGNPNLQLHLLLTNIGGRSIRIKDIVISLSRDGTNLASLPAQNYLQNQSDKSTLLFTTFSLLPNQEWGHIVNFLNFFDREEEKKYRNMEKAINLEILEKKSILEKDSKELVEASPDKVSPFQELFDEKFVWLAGEYSLKVKVITDKENVDIEKSYRFTLFEYYEESLRKITEQYKYGAGTDIYYSPEPLSVSVDIKET